MTLFSFLGGSAMHCSVRRCGPPLLLAALPWVPPLSGQEVQDTTRLKELVVTATRLATPANAVTSSVTVISGEELRARGVRFVQEALREVPGASVVQVGSYGGVSSLFLRGGESDYVKVLIDGVPVNQSGGSYNWANLTTDNIDHIEVLRGPASVVYGSDAVTGVVQVFTRTGRGPTAVEGRAEGGTFGSINGQGSVLGGSDRLSYSGDVSRISTDGTYPFNNDYGNTVVSGRIHARPDEQSDLAVTGRWTDNQYRFPTDFSGALTDSNQFTAERAVVLGVDVSRKLSDRYELRISGAGSRSDDEFDDASDRPGDTLGFGFASHRDSRADRGNVDARLSAFLNSQLTVTAGAQVERETERQSGVSTSNFGGIAMTPDTPFDRGRTTVGGYAQAVLDLPSGLALDVNGRLDDNSGFGTFGTYRAGVSYRIGSGSRIRSSLGRAFKAPTFCEQFCDAPFVVGDSALRPEHSFSWEVGLEQQLGAGHTTIWATYFDQHFHDMILYDGSAAPGEPTYFNGAAAKARGLETGVSTALGRRVTASASYTYLLTEATDDAGAPSPDFAVGERLIRRPAHSAELAVRSAVVDRVTLGGSVTYVGSRDDVDFNQSPSARVTLPGYALVDLAGELELFRGRSGGPEVSGTLRVENLFNQPYEQVVGFGGRPRGVFGGARFRI
jgi:vitamin B12 transporter